MKNLLLHIFAASLMFIGVDARAEYLGDLIVESGDVYELLLDEVGDYVELDMLVVEEGAELYIDNGILVRVKKDVEVSGLISGQDANMVCKGNLIGGGSVTISEITFSETPVSIECNLEVQGKFSISEPRTLVTIMNGYFVKAETMNLSTGTFIEGLIYLKAGKGAAFDTPGGRVVVTSTGDDGAYLAVKYTGSKASQTSSTDAVNGVVYMSLDPSYYTLMALDGDVTITSISLKLDEGHSDLYSIADKSSRVSSLYYSTNKWNEFSNIKSVEGITTDATCSLTLSDGESTDIAYGIRRDFIEDVINNEASGSTITAVRIDSKTPGKYTWTGKKGTSFKDNSNWYGGYTPESSVDVVINSEYSEAAISAIFTISGAEEASRPNGATSGTSYTVKNFPVIGSGTSVTVKSLKLNGPSKITIDGGSLKVTNALTVQNSGEEGHVIINNRASSSSALKYGSTNYSKFVVNRYFPQGKSYYVGSATTNGSVEGLGSDDMIAVYSGDDFGVTTSFNGSIIGGGIMLQSTDHIKQVGSLFAGGQSASGSSKKEGWMLFQNPFMSAVSASLSSFTFGNGLAKSLVFPTEGGFTTKNLGSGVTVLDNLKYGADGRSSIAPQQAFYVLTIDPEQGTSFTIKEPTSPRAGVSLKSTRVETDVLRLTLGSESSFDETALVFRESGDMKATSDDSYKMNNGDMKCSQIYVIKDESKISVALLPEQSNDMEIKLGFRMSSKQTSATIKATNLDVFESNADIYLNDKKLDKSINLSEVGSYEFAAKAGEIDDTRFTITLKNLGTPNVDVVVEKAIKIFKSADEVVVTLPDNLLNKATASVYDIAGRLISQQSIEATRSSVSLPAAKGVYVVKVVAGDEVADAKFIF